MAAMARTPVLPRATPVGALSAQFEASKTALRYSALRRLQPAASRKYRSLGGRLGERVDKYKRASQFFYILRRRL
jgi:hypothetical protein